MEIELFESNNGRCPYLNQREWLSYTFRANHLDGKVYESLIDQGFRRSGLYFYKNNCSECEECRSIRIIVNEFKMSKSQRRTWNKNQDLTLESHPVKFDRDSFDLYSRYTMIRHNGESSERGYREFLIRSAVETIMVRYSLGERLVGVSWLDVLPHSLSSVYFAFDTEFEKRRLGVFSALKEIEMARSMDKSYLHMGFWVKDCLAMSYKNQYKPYQLLVKNHWKGMEWVSKTHTGS